MKNDEQSADTSALEATAEECSMLILLRSKERILKVPGPFQSEHKAYMALACAATEAIKAFLALDESMK
jgi:hypothetical protein